jgi:hypothetical protein
MKGNSIMSQDHPTPHLDERDELLVRIIAREIVHQIRMHEIEFHSPRQGPPGAETLLRQRAEERIARRSEGATDDR